MKSGDKRKILLVILVTVVFLWSYTAIVNRNSVNMTTKQKLLKAFYPVLMLFSKKQVYNNTENKAMGNTSFYNLKVIANNGSEIDFSAFKGKKVLLVNTASNCGYTSQYEALQKLYELYADSLVIIGFPANDFKEQEKGTDTEIAQFCKVNYGVSFPLAKKSSVVKGAGQNEVFRWLSDKVQNGWNDQQPVWNFSKYLVNENGVLTHFFAPAVSPLSKEVTDAIMKP